MRTGKVGNNNNNNNKKWWWGETLDVPGQFLDEFARVDGVEFHGEIQGLRSSTCRENKRKTKLGQK
jgi:hypothetical protein